MNSLLIVLIICVPAVLLTQNVTISLQHYCYVQSPTDDTIFNLTTLNHELNDSLIRISDNEQIRVHFCRPLKDPCDGKQDYAVCLHVNNTKQIGLGKEPPQVSVEVEKIIFKYTGDKCNETHDYTVDFEMICNFAMRDQVAVDLDIIYTRDQCGFHMTIETLAACARKKQTVCEFKDETGDYNLSSLMNLSNNYKALLPNSSTFFLLNVCHSLLYGEHFNDCNHDTMICMVDPDADEDNIYTSIGNINDDVRFSTVNGNVHLDLTSETPCVAKDGNELGTVRTTIEFVCKEHALNRLPKYKNGIGTCHYRFRWQTVAACSEEVLIKHSQFRHQPCKVTDPLYSKIYDLSMLEGKVFYSNSGNKNAEYQFSVCSPLRRTNCTRPGTAVCKYIKDQKVGVSVGVSNTNLQWRRGRIYLNYTDGAACGDNRRSYTTIIFTCGDDDSLLIDDEDPCVTIISWTTTMVCNRRCATADYKINLEKLGRHSSNYVARGETNSTEYHVNVCEPLVNDHYTNCSGDTGICKVVNDENGKRISEISLGYADTGVRKAKDGRVFLKYLNGSVCEEDSDRRISTEITFTCDIEANAIGHIFFGLGENFMLSEAFFKFMKLYQGTPVFKSYNDCKYNFEWRSGLSCDSLDVEMSQDCLLTKKIEIFDLVSLTRNSHFKINKTESTGFFNVSVCGKHNQCKGNFVCDNKNFYRKDVNTTRTPTNNLVIFKFENETKCKNNIFHNSVIKLWCNIWSDLAESLLINDDECMNGPEWYTNRRVVCNPNQNITEIVTGEDMSKVPATPATVIKMMSLIVLTATTLVLVFHFRYGYRRTLFINVARYYINRYILWRRDPPPTEELALG